MVYTNSMNPLKGTREISPKAAKLLKEIQLKLSDTAPTISLSEIIPEKSDRIQIKSDTDTFDGKSIKSLKFSKAEYESDVRGHKSIYLLGSLLIFVSILYLTSFFYFDFLENSLHELRKTALEVKAAPVQNITLQSQILDLSNRRKAVEDNYLNLTNQFPDPSGIYTLYSNFLESIQGNKLEVLSQQGTITQAKNSPLMTMPLLEEEKAFKSQVIQMKKDALGHMQAPSNFGSGTNSSSKELILSGDVKDGLNFYHLEILFSGSYVGYLNARQSLVKEIPNAIVHRELILTNPNSLNDLAIKIHLSIPFVDSI